MRLCGRLGRVWAEDGLREKRLKEGWAVLRHEVIRGQAEADLREGLGSAEAGLIAEDNAFPSGGFIEWRVRQPQGLSPRLEHYHPQLISDMSPLPLQTSMRGGKEVGEERGDNGRGRRERGQGEHTERETAKREEMKRERETGKREESVEGEK